MSSSHLLVQPGQPEPDTPRFEHPKVICIDTNERAVTTIAAAGYRVTAGTLGTAYAVEASDSFVQPFRSENLPGLAEQEVVVVQHLQSGVSNQPTGRPPIQTRQVSLWASCRYGVVDPRHVAAVGARDDIAQILDFGGAVISFCSADVDAGLVLAAPFGGSVEVQQTLDLKTARLVRELGDFDFKGHAGEEIQPSTANGPFGPITLHLQSARYVCTITPPASAAERFVSLAKNKYGADVAGVFVPASGNGLVVLLPQVVDVGGTVQALLDDVLPELVPRVFPESEKFGWREKPPYELPEVHRLREEITQVRADAAAKETAVMSEIDAAKAEDGWLLDLLSGTGEELVNAAERALREVGLSDVEKIGLSRHRCR